MKYKYGDKIKINHEFFGVVYGIIQNYSKKYSRSFGNPLKETIEYEIVILDKKRDIASVIFMTGEEIDAQSI